MCCVVCCARVRLESCVPNVISLCGLFILECPFGFLERLFSILSHGWCSLVINLRNTYFDCFNLLLGILLTFDCLFLLVPIVFNNIFMDRINETINHDIIYSTWNLWYDKRQSCSYFFKWQDDRFWNISMDDWTINLWFGQWSLNTYLQVWTDDIGHIFWGMGHNIGQ